MRIHGVIERKGPRKKIDEPPERNHDKERDDTIHDEMCALCSLFFIAPFGEVGEHSPKNREDSKRDDERYERIQETAHLADETNDGLRI